MTVDEVANNGHYRGDDKDLSQKLVQAQMSDRNVHHR